MANPDKIVNFGVIGCGVIGPQHMESITELPGCHLAAVADVDETRARAAAEKFSADRHYGDPIALIDDPQVDAVILALPAGLRTELAIEALRRGKPVMLEKPAARSVAEFDTIAAVAGNTPVACASARYVFLPHCQPVRDLLTAGRLGTLRSVLFRCLTPPGPRPTAPPPAWRVSRQLNGGGILVNWSTYELDYIWSLTGWTLRPRHVLARWWQIPPQFQEYVAPGSDADEHFAAMITCDGGVAVYLERGERVASSPQTLMQMVGSAGTVDLNWIPGEGKRLVFTDITEDGPRQEVVWQGDEGWELGRQGIIADFAEALRTGRQPHTNLERGRMMQQIIDAIYLSGDEDRPVAIS